MMGRSSGAVPSKAAAGRGLFDWIMTGVVVVLIVALSAVVAGGVMGYRLVTIKSGSMTPTLGVGDVILDQSVQPLAVRPGQIVTFRDPALGQRLVTHRVVSMHRSGDIVRFVTKGDANLATEHWSVPVSAHLGRTLFVVPGAGSLLATITSAAARVLGIVLAIVFVAYLGLRWIWRSPDPALVGKPKPA